MLAVDVNSGCGWKMWMWVLQGSGGLRERRCNIQYEHVIQNLNYIFTELDGSYLGLVRVHLQKAIDGECLGVLPELTRVRLLECLLTTQALAGAS